MNANTDMRALPAPERFRLLVEDEAGIGWLIVNRPEKRNAFDLSMWRALPRLATRLAAEDAVRVIVLRGAGGHFGAGADIAEFETVRAGAAAAEYERVHEEGLEILAALPSPVIAMIEGFCIGGGLAVALACDLRVAAEDALFALPPARLGLAFPTRGFSRMLMALSASHAAEMLFTGARFDTSWALRTGLINAVHPADALEGETRALARAIAANAPLSLRHAKAALRAAHEGRIDTRLAELEALAEACFSSADYEEGRRAFLERRRPRFKGR